MDSSQGILDAINNVKISGTANSPTTIKYINLAKKHLYLLFKLKEENVIIGYSSFMVNKLQDNPKDWPFKKIAC